MTSTFARDARGDLLGEHMYGRYGNPTRDRLERALAQLEGAGSAYAMPSGLAATHAVLQACCGPGDRVLIPPDLYFGVRRQVLDLLQRWGLRAEVVDLTDLDAVEAALRQPAAMVWIETPSNPQLAITDIAAIVERAHAAGARVAVDNTWPTPVLTRPLALGADLVLHSTTKYLGGHSDVVGGAIVLPVESPVSDRIEAMQKVGGAVAGPFDAWLVLRGLRTLSLRVRAASRSAAVLCDWLDQQEGVCVAYPGLVGHPGHAVAARQMRGGFGAMFSARFGSAARAREVAGRLRLWTRATSLGGVESLVEHRAPVEGPGTETPGDLLRFSVGIEDVEDLRADLQQALR